MTPSTVLRSWSAVVLYAVSIAVTVGAEVEPARQRRLLFLGRDSVVIEEGKPIPLLDGESRSAPAIVVAPAPEGVGQASESRLLLQAASALSKYLEQVTGLPCPVRNMGSEQGLMSNGSFEEPPLPGEARNPSLSGEWRIYLNRSGTAKVFLDQTTSHEGKSSATAKGKTEPSGYAGVLRNIPVQQGKRYRLAFWYRTHTDDGGNAVVVMPHLRPVLKVVLPSSKAWKRHEMVFEVNQPRGNWLIVIMALLGGKTGDSQVWFDDVRFEAADAPKQTAAATERRILVRAMGRKETVFPELRKVDGQGFAIAMQDSDLHIVGASGAGALYGTWFFLMNYAGVRIVMPGEIGEVCPPRRRIEVPSRLYVLNPGPDYRMRTWSQPDFDDTVWLGDESSTNRYQFHHNMARIYSPGRFAKTHPEYYPMRGGKRRIPPAKERSRWQPTFSSNAVVKRACDYADEMFSANPRLRSISLSVNDGGGFSSIDLERAKEAGGLSNVYYRYVNAVAAYVKRKWPGRHVACLAYHAVAAPPDFNLEDNVIIFLMNEAKIELAKWRPRAKHFGVYQWIYGKWWVIPNHWPHAMQEYLRWFRDQGGFVFKGETYGNWAYDGPKSWVLDNLLWNVDADVDSLLRDYYEHAYGPEAAPAMARYFRRAEAVYERRRKDPRYIFSFDSMFDKTVGYGWKPSDRQFWDMTADDIRFMDQALAEAERKVRGDDNRKRLSFTRHTFTLARMYFDEYVLFKQLAGKTVETPEDLKKVLTAAGGLRGRVEARRAFCREKLDPTWQLHAMAYYWKRKRGDPPDRLDWEKIDDSWRLDWEGSILNVLLKAVSNGAQEILGREDRPGPESVGQALDRLIPQGDDPIFQKVRDYSSKYYFANKTDRPPKVDGVLDDPCWRKAQVESGFVKLRSGEAADHKSEFMLCYDNTHVYLAFRGYQDPSKLVAMATVRDDKVWHDDSMEFVVHQADAKGRSYYHIIVNTKGGIYDWIRGDKSFNTTAKIGTGIRPDRYVLEFAIPFSELRRVGVHPAARFVKLNVMRNYNGGERLNDPALVSSWYFTRGSNLHVDSRGWLCLLP
jgi:hypothetical protein